MTVEELIKKLETLPQDADVFVSNLCMGWLDGSQVKYDEGWNAVLFEDKMKALNNIKK